MGRGGGEGQGLATSGRFRHIKFYKGVPPATTRHTRARVCGCGCGPQSRNKMSLGYNDPATGEFKKSSSVQLRNTMRVADDEATRRACYESMRSVGPYVAEKFLQIVKERNRLARMMGYEDFYDYKVLPGRVVARVGGGGEGPGCVCVCGGGEGGVCA